MPDAQVELLPRATRKRLPAEATGTARFFFFFFFLHGKVLYGPVPRSLGSATVNAIPMPGRPSVGW